MDVLWTFKIKIESQKLDIGCTKDQWPNPNQDPVVKPQSGTSSILESSESGLKGHGCSLHHHNKDRKSILGPRVYQRPVTISKSISKSWTPDMEPPASSKAPNQDLKDIDALCTFKTMIEGQNLDHWFTKDQSPYPNPDQDVKPQSGTSSVLQIPKWGLEGHGCSLHLLNQDKGPKFGSQVYQIPLTIFESRSR